MEKAISQKVGDLTLHMNPGAYEVLKILDKMNIETPSWFYVFTSAWYNGRERGFVINAQSNFYKILHIAVYECKSSDDICLLQWESDSLDLNGPIATKETLSLAYKEYFLHEEYEKCAQSVYKRVKNYYLASLLVDKNVK